jgi:hypothetical protein
MAGAKSGLLETAGSLRVRHQRREITSAVHHADDLDALGDLAVQDDIASYREIAKARRNVGPRRAEAGLIGEKQEPLFDVIGKRGRTTKSSWACDAFGYGGYT